jgi:prepilin-type processing-associated H-X9-DG protein
MRDAAAEQALAGKFLVDMQRIVIADQPGKQRNVAFADGAAAGAARRVDFEIFEIKALRALPLFHSCRRPPAADS